MTTPRFEDEDPKVRALLASIKAARPTLSQLLDSVDSPRNAEDCVYRFYHVSYKVFRLQDETTKIVEALQALAPADGPLDPTFMQLVKEGTGKSFSAEANGDWLESTRPIVEAFFHARFFLQMAVTYGKDLEYAPGWMPSGWALLLILFGLRH